jgi:tripartite-type tricarboxylate transporter receptor subunit TctC
MNVLLRILMLACLTAAPASAQTFPTRAVHIVVPWPPGAVDVFIRAMQQAMEQDLGQSIIIDNKPGANGFIGTMQVAAAKPDGYTLLFNVSSSIVMGPLTSSEAKFDTIKDFAPVTNVFDSPMVLAAKPSLPASTLPELIEWLKKNPKQGYGTPGIGSTPHVLGETFRLAAKVDLVHVPYRGFAPMIQAITGDEVAVGFIATATAKPVIMDGRMKVFGVDRGPVEDADLSKLVSLADTLPGFDSTPTFAGLFAPAETPRPIIDRLNAAAVKALRSPEVRARVGLGGQRVIADTPDEFAASIKKNVATLSRLVGAAKAAGAKFE